MKQLALLVLLCILLGTAFLHADKNTPPRDKNGHYPGLVSYLDSLRSQPDSEDRYILLAEYWLQRPDFERYDATVAEGLLRYPASLALLRHQAQIHTRNANYDEATAIYARLCTGAPSSELELDYAHNEKLAGRIDTARRLYASVYARHPQQREVFDAYHRFLIAYIAEKDAQRLMLGHLRRYGGSADLWLQAGDVWIDRNKPYRALHAFEQANPDSNIVAGIMQMRLKQFLRPSLYGRFEFIEEDLPVSNTRYKRLYASINHRPTDWLTVSAEVYLDHVARRYHDVSFSDNREERDISALTGTMHLMPVPSLYVGVNGQYYIRHEHWGDFGFSCEQNLEWEQWAFWWRVILAENVVEHWEFMRQREYTAQVELSWQSLSLWNGYSHYYTPDDEVFQAPEYPWMYDDIVVRDNYGYRNHTTLEYTVLEQPSLSLGFYGLAQGYDYESRFYSTPSEQLYYGILADYGTMLADLELDVSGQLGLNEDQRSHWTLSIDAGYEAGPFRVTLGLSLDDDEYSSSRTLSFTVSDLSL
ncbi:MAG: hypothetical protein K8R90_00350 [Candidatus Cloacimonetes bacterium]|nr:hypothetical protein [Candidatus Cloacimonadota bacterium]